jgi:uncharacterized protein (DUF983 family)
VTVRIETADDDQRLLLPAILNGLRCSCPKCGKRKLFRAYLKVADRCDNCGEEFFHHKADDLPPYISIVIVGHILVGLMLHLEMEHAIAPIWYVVTLLPLALVLPLALLPSIKGAVVGLQWANRMHGFDPRHRDPALPDTLD